MRVVIVIKFHIFHLPFLLGHLNSTSIINIQFMAQVVWLSEKDIDYFHHQLACCCLPYCNLRQMCIDSLHYTLLPFRVTFSSQSHNVWSTPRRGIFLSDGNMCFEVEFLLPNALIFTFERLKFEGSVLLI